MTGLEYGLFDCDTHCYETRDAFTRYLPKQCSADRAIAPVRVHDGTEVILAGDRIAVFNSEQGLGFDLAYRPGSLKEMLRQMASGNPDETYQPEPMRPEYVEREATARADGRAGRRAGGHVSRRRWRCRSSTTSSDTAAAVRQHALVQPVVRRGVGLQHGTARSSPRRCCRCATWTWPSRRPSSSSAAARGSCCCRPARRTVARRATRTSTRSGPGCNEAGVTGRLPHHAVLVLRAISPGWGHDPIPASWHMSAWQWKTSTASGRSRTRCPR